MTKRKYRNYSRLFFFFSAATSVLLIEIIFTKVGLQKIVLALTCGFSVIMQLRLALLMRRKSQDLDLKE